MKPHTALIFLLAIAATAPRAAYGLDAIKNTTAEPLSIVDIEDKNHDVVAHLYVMPGETMKLTAADSPAAGAGYYEAVAGQEYFVWILPKLSLPGLDKDACPCALHVDKIGWDREGKLTAIAGLRPYLVAYPNRKIPILSNVEHPHVANGKLYFKLAGHGSSEYWVRTRFDQVVESGGPWGWRETAGFLLVYVLPLVPIGLLVYSLVGAIRLMRSQEYPDKSFLELMRLSFLSLLVWRRNSEPEWDEA
jgi:hypothetical protein